MSYTLVKKLSQGGMAEIFLARKLDRKGNLKLWCIKRILSNYANDEEFSRMFRDEYRITKRFVHPNLIAIKEYAFINQTPAIVMEFVPGTDIRDILSACERSNKRLSVPMVCYLVAQASRGLGYAHDLKNEHGQALKIVHRDVSPQNILVSFKGAVKVIDFGIADTHAKLNVTKPGVIKGKFSYMSPEQVTMKPVDARTDIFALGVVLWEMLSMRKLFQGENEIQTIELVKRGKIPHDLQKLNSDVNESLMNIINKALARSSNERYASAKDLDSDLSAHIDLYYPDFNQKKMVTFLRELMAKKYRKVKENIKLASKIKDKDSSSVESSYISGAGSLGRSSWYKKSTASNMSIDNMESDLAGSFEPVFEGASTHNRAEELESSEVERELNLVASQEDLQSTQSQLRLSHTPLSPQQGGAQQNSPYHATYDENKNQNKKSFLDKSLRDKKTFTYSLIAACAVLGMMVLYGIFQLSQQSSMNKNVQLNATTTVTINTFPSRTKISLNGQDISKSYLESPYSLSADKLNEGKNTIKISRAGFEATTHSFDKADLSGDKEIIISLKTKTRMGALFLIAHPKSSAQKVEYSFSDNLATGHIQRNNNSRITYLLPGQNYLVSFKTKDTKFRCKLASSQAGKKMVYMIYPEIEACIRHTR